MKRRIAMRHMSASILACLALSICASSVAAEEGRFGVGLRAGPSFYTQDLISGGTPTEGDTGPLVSVQGFYRAAQWWTLGLALEYETHGSTEAGIDLGDVSTVTFFPYVEVRPWNGTLVPYGVLGAGGNFNSFEESTDLQVGCLALLGTPCSVDLDDTFAVRVGGGLDYFIASNLALNAELGWKYNAGDATVSVSGASASADADLSTLSVLFGGRLLF